MGKPQRKKVVKKVLIGFRKEALKLISERVQRTGQNETDALHDILMGLDRLGPTAEQAIEQEMKQFDLKRDAAIERIILDVMRARGDQ